MKYTITSLLLFVLLTAGCNNQPQNTERYCYTRVGNEIEERFYQQAGQYDRYGTAYLWSNAQFRNEWLVHTANQSPYRQAL